MPRLQLVIPVARWYQDHPPTGISYDLKFLLPGDRVGRSKLHSTLFTPRSLRVHLSSSGGFAHPLTHLCGQTRIESWISKQLRVVPSNLPTGSFYQNIDTMPFYRRIERLKHPESHFALYVRRSKSLFPVQRLQKRSRKTDPTKLHRRNEGLLL